MILFAMILTLVCSTTVLVAVYTVRRNVRTQLSMSRSHRRHHPGPDSYGAAQALIPAQRGEA